MSVERSGSSVRRISELNLNAEQRQVVEETITAVIAVNVYRELKHAQELARAAGSGCNIIGNCSCSSQQVE
jgi:hypothetical protein